MAGHEIDLEKQWRRWRYKNTTFLLLSLLAFLYLARTPSVDALINATGNLGYIGAFVAGIFFVSTFTVAPAAVVLFHIAEKLQPYEVALLAGVGAMIGDYLVFRFIKDRVADEIMPLLKKLNTPRVRGLFRSPYFSWLIPALGAIIIASPLPDEAGVSMLGLSKIKPWQFLLLVFALNTVGIFLVVSLARL